MPVEPIVIEGVSSPRSLTDELIEYATTGVKPDAEILTAFGNAGFVFDDGRAFLTDTALDIVEAANVPIGEIAILTLGSDIHPKLEDGQTIHLKAGSTLQILFARRDKKYGEYWECAAGVHLPILVVYKSKAHTVETHRWPLAIPLTATVSSIAS